MNFPTTFDDIRKTIIFPLKFLVGMPTPRELFISEVVMEGIN